MKTLFIFSIRISILIAFFFCSNRLFSQENKISGSVVFPDGSPIPGVSVLSIIGNKGVITDFDGLYSIQADKGDVLEFSFLGLNTEKITIADQNILNVIMKVASTELEEVFIGYGKVKKKDLTGAVSVLDEKVFKDRAVVSVDDALKGQVSGLSITSSDGTPGGGARIRIRGTSTISGSGEPLYVIDGVPLETSGTSDSFNGSTEGNPLAFLNPNDIQSIQVLKDASSTAIYGSRASNGVIIITTKTGKNQESKLNVSLSVKGGISTQGKYYDVMDIKEYAEVRFYQDAGNAGSEWWPKDSFDTWQQPGVVSGDWQRALGQTGALTDYSLQVSGKDKKTSYSLSLGYLNQTGVMVATDFERISSRFNLTQTIDKKLKFSTNLSFTQNNKNGLFAGVNGSGLISANLIYSPKFDPYDSSGALNIIDDGLNYTPSNPLLEALGTKKRVAQFTGNYRFGLEYKISNALNFRPSIALTTTRVNVDIYFPTDSNNGRLTNGKGTLIEVKSNTFLQENVLIYTKNLGKHFTNTMLGSSIRVNKVNNSRTGNFTNFPDEDLNTDYAGYAVSSSIPSSNNSEPTLLSAFTRISYNYDQKYYATATMRADGSNKFSTSNKWGYFPSFALRWRASREKFLENNDQINDLSFRTSYGITGNQGIPSFSTYGSSTVRKTIFNGSGQTGLVGLQRENPDLTWETSSQFDFGLDLEMFNNRFSVNADIYYKLTEDMLLSKPIPLYSGFESRKENSGSIENKGLELGLKGTIIDKSFKWDANFTLAFNRNKILSLGDTDELILDILFFPTQVTDELILRKGEPIGNWYGYVYDGVYASWDEINNGTITNQLGYVRDDSNSQIWANGNTLRPGLAKYKDLNNDGIIDANDKTIIGNGLPDFTGGLAQNFSYGNFSLNVLFTFSYGAENYNGNLASLTNSSLPWNKVSDFSDFFKADYIDGDWVFSNTDAKYQSPKWRDSNQSTSLYVSDASFIRLSNISLGYQVSSKLAAKVGFKAVRIFATGTNLFLWTNYNGYDPETTTGQGFVSGGTSKNLAPGFDAGAFPSSKTISLGINLRL